MMQNSDRHRTNPWVMALVVVGFIVSIPILVITFSSHDLQWWNPRFTDTPARVVVYQNGKQTDYMPGKPGYNELAAAVTESLNAGVSHSSGIGMSDDSLQEAYSKYLTVEAFFTKPAKIHAPFDTFQPMVMLFPITGRHSDIPTVFLNVNGKYMSNPPYLKTLEPLRNALKKQGYNIEPVD